LTTFLTVASLKNGIFCQLLGHGYDGPVDAGALKAAAYATTLIFNSLTVNPAVSSTTASYSHQ